MLLTQFLGALNDNILRFLIVYFILTKLDLAPNSAGIYIALSGAIFTLPFLFLSPLAGQWTDRRSKRSVLIITKSWEIPSMILAFLGLWLGDLNVLLLALFLTACQAAFFGPAKYAIIPELVRIEELSYANAWIGGSTFLGILMGATAAGGLADLGNIILSGALLVAIAFIGFGAAFFIGSTNPPLKPPVFHYNLAREAWSLLLEIKKINSIWLSALLISYLWFLGALLQLLLPQFGKAYLQLSASVTQTLLFAAALGIISGCFLAGNLSGEKIRLNISKIGISGMALSTFGLSLGSPNYWLAFFWLLLLGISGGLFIIPLYALMQRNAPAARRGRTIAANNLLNTIALLCASLFLYLGSLLKLSSQMIILVIALLSIVITIFFVRLR